MQILPIGIRGYIGDNLVISGIISEKNLPVSYPVEYVEYIDVDNIRKEVCDNLIAEVESNPELIYPLLMQPIEVISHKDILPNLTEAIVAKLATDKTLIL